MNRSNIKARRLAECERQEKLRLAQIKMGSALVEIDELGRRYKEEVDSQIKVIRETTDKQLLQMKWSDFLALEINRFGDHPGAGELPFYRRFSGVLLRSSPAPKAPAATPRSRSNSQHRGRIRTKQQTWTRVKSADRAAKEEDPTFTFLRWPRAGELVLSKAGSPLAVHKPLEHCANVLIPTSSGVITVKPHKLNQVKREVVMNLDPNALNQVKTLTTNLGKIVDMATKMGKK